MSEDDKTKFPRRTFLKAATIAALTATISGDSYKPAPKPKPLPTLKEAEHIVDPMEKAQAELDIAIIRTASELKAMQKKIGIMGVFRLGSGIDINITCQPNQQDICVFSNCDGPLFQLEELPSLVRACETLKVLHEEKGETFEYASIAEKLDKAVGKTGLPYLTIALVDFMDHLVTSVQKLDAYCKCPVVPLDEHAQPKFAIKYTQTTDYGLPITMSVEASHPAAAKDTTFAGRLVKPVSHQDELSRGGAR